MFGSVCVYCGSSEGHNPAFVEAAREVGRSLALSGTRLIYGGAGVGLMNEVAQAALDAGGTVIGVLPEKLFDWEIGRHDLTRLEVVPDMHRRKARMAELADAFVALPGGYGTFEELFEAMTWTQIGYHLKPVGALDVAGFFQPFVALLDHFEAQGFSRVSPRSVVQVDADFETLLVRMHAALKAREAAGPRQGP